MTLLKREITTFFFIVLATAVSLLFLSQKNNKIDGRVFSALPDFLTPTPAVFVPGPIETSSMDSPDGSKTLTLEKQQLKDYIRYSFFTSLKSGAEKELIFKKEVNPSVILSIPYNTWSPDYKYVFVKEMTPVINNYYVLWGNSQFLDIQTLFGQKMPDYAITNVTGWAAPNLVIVNAQSKEGDKKVSFWFEVPSRSFIQLGTYFQ